MSKPRIFISCGQWTEGEKFLGKYIADQVKQLTDFEPFYAENVQDLNGLDHNILNALHECFALIVVMHPRGKITRPDGSVVNRASVWIEQEIAIATYIQRVEKRDIPIIAFAHRDIGREGIRDVLHLNPIPFTRDAEVMAAVTEQLAKWKGALFHQTRDISLQLKATNLSPRDGHNTKSLAVSVSNDTDDRIETYDLKVSIPEEFLKHSNAHYAGEVATDEMGYRCFRLSQANYGVISPRSSRGLFSTTICPACALEARGGSTWDVKEATFRVQIWVAGKRYSLEKSLKQLAADRDAGLSR